MRGSPSGTAGPPQPASSPAAPPRRWSELALPPPPPAQRSKSPGAPGGRAPLVLGGAGRKSVCGWEDGARTRSRSRSRRRATPSRDSHGGRRRRYGETLPRTPTLAARRVRPKTNGSRAAGPALPRGPAPSPAQARSSARRALAGPRLRPRSACSCSQRVLSFICKMGALCRDIETIKCNRRRLSAARLCITLMHSFYSPTRVGSRPGPMSGLHTRPACQRPCGPKIASPLPQPRVLFFQSSYHSEITYTCYFSLPSSPGEPGPCPPCPSLGTQKLKRGWAHDRCPNVNE